MSIKQIELFIDDFENLCKKKENVSVAVHVESCWTSYVRRFVFFRLLFIRFLAHMIVDLSLCMIMLNIS
jgi:hypothetical protein